MSKWFESRNSIQARKYVIILIYFSFYCSKSVTYLNNYKYQLYSYPIFKRALHYAAMTNAEPYALRILIKFGAFVNIINDEMMSPLFNAVTANNPLAASILIKANADYKIRNNDGQTAFDLIKDMSEWINCDFFDQKMKGVLKSKININRGRKRLASYFNYK